MEKFLYSELKYIFNYGDKSLIDVSYPTGEHFSLGLDVFTLAKIDGSNFNVLEKEIIRKNGSLSSCVKYIYCWL